MGGGRLSAHGATSTASTPSSASFASPTPKEVLAKAYKRGDLIERRRAAMQQWADWLSGPATADAIPLAGRRA